MKDYKGIYHDTESTTDYYEFGAHFKYIELYDALNNLKKERMDNIPLEQDFSSKQKNKETIEPSKKRKRYKLNTLNIKNNERYSRLITDINEKEKEISVIEEEKDDNNKIKKRRLTKSLDKILLPKIHLKNNNNDETFKNKILSPIKSFDGKKDNNNYKLQKLSKPLNLKKKNISEKKEKFPKINSSYYKEILQDNNDNNKEKVEETQSKFQDNNESIKIFNHNEETILKRRRNLKKMTNMRNERLLSNLNNEQEKYFESLRKPNIKLDKLKSIFEKEKEIKKINLFLGQKNNYSSNNRNLMNEEMAQQIHNLKIQTLGVSNGK